MHSTKNGKSGLSSNGVDGIRVTRLPLTPDPSDLQSKLRCVRTSDLEHLDHRWAFVLQNDTWDY